MAVFSRWTQSLAALSLLAATSSAWGQEAAPGAMQASRAYRHVAPSPMPVSPGQFTRPNVAAHAQRPSQPTAVAKPFQMTPQRPTVSPYLQLHREDLDDTLPNYFAFVLPQMQQQELIQQQQAELARIHQRLLQTSRRPGAVAGDEAAEATSGQPFSYHARFLNTGGYFSGVATPPASPGPNGQ